ncbi:hypothetical protein BH23CHL9_BH23CHL9_13970 [soil metagenome]
MERFIHRSTSQADLLAEMHERDLLEEARRRHLPRPTDAPRRIFGLRIPGRRRR